MTEDEEKFADLENHYIEGFSSHGGFKIHLPLFSHIVDNLWVGGCPRQILPSRFQYVVCLYPWERYHFSPTTVFLQAQLYDAAEEPDKQTVVALATAVNAFRKAGTTLVHCQAGLNRSNLIAGMALILDGFQPDAAIKLLRAQRGQEVLCNRTFEEWLRRQA